MKVHLPKSARDLHALNADFLSGDGDDYRRAGEKADALIQKIVGSTRMNVKRKCEILRAIRDGAAADNIASRCSSALARL